MKYIPFFIICFMFTMPVYAGTLSDFEKDATKKKEGSGSNRKINGSDNDRRSKEGIAESIARGLVEGMAKGVEEGIGEVVFGGIAVGLKEGGGTSAARIEAFNCEKYDTTPRKDGEALIPFLRLDAAYQFVDTDVTAADLRAEIGYASLGIEARQTRYWEDEPRDTLSITQIHGLYRMSIGDKVELDLGLGQISLSGRNYNSGISFTMPVLFHPSEHYGFEFRPSWSSINGNVIYDYDAAVMTGWRYISLRAGYRWIMTDDQALNGPQIGVSVYW